MFEAAITPSYQSSVCVTHKGLYKHKVLCVRTHKRGYFGLLLLDLVQVFSTQEIILSAKRL